MTITLALLDEEPAIEETSRHIQAEWTVGEGTREHSLQDGTCTKVAVLSVWHVAKGQSLSGHDKCYTGSFSCARISDRDGYKVRSHTISLGGGGDPYLSLESRPTARFSQKELRQYFDEALETVRSIAASDERIIAICTPD